MTGKIWVSGLIIPVVLGGLLAHPTTSAAQDGTSNPLRDGSWAIQFRITDNFSLSTFSGSVISVKRHYSARSALRAGLSLSLSAGSLESERAFQDTTITARGDSDAYSFRVELQYLGYTSPSRKVSPYWGVGPLVGYAYSYSRGSSPGSDLIQERREWTLGLIGSLGAEWFPTSFLGA